MSNDQQHFWNERYSHEAFAYGEAPNEYLKTILTELRPGKILFPAEGEGRNAVFAAKLGWTVAAFDSSEAGKKKAKLLADKNNVAFEYTISDVADSHYPESSFDALALIYAHFHSNQRKAYHQKLSASLKQGGVLILEAFGKEQSALQKEKPKSGGPKDVDMLYDLEELKGDFDGFAFIQSMETTTLLNEGAHHQGQAHIINIYAIKK